MIPKAEEGREKVIYSPITLIYVDATLLIKKFSKFNENNVVFQRLQHSEQVGLS